MKSAPVSQKNKLKNASPVRTICGSFALLIIVGTILFMFPISTKSGQGMSLIQSLFTATSATCVTGLTIVDPYTTLSTFGQVVLLMLIQFGGLGIVTITSFFLIMFSKRVGLKSLKLAQMNSNAFSITSMRSLMVTIVCTTLIIETIGAFLLSIRFVPTFGPEGLWMAIFTAISAYCNAGFDLLGKNSPFSSLITVNNDPLILITIMFLIILGGIGFIVFNDIITWRKGRHLMLHTKLVLWITVILIVSGAILFFASEYTNSATIGNMPLWQKILNSFFQSVTTRTAGFSSVDISAMNDMTKFFMMVWMFIGAGSGSTGGGVKITTIAVLVMTVVSAIKDREDTVIMKHRIDKKIVYKSMAITMSSLFIIFVTTSIVFFSSPTVNGIDGIFESISAFATVGLTANTTLFVGFVGKLSLILTMFIGRVGPVSFALSFISKNDAIKGEILPEGKIIVG